MDLTTYHCTYNPAICVHNVDRDNFNLYRIILLFCVSSVYGKGISNVRQ